MPTDSKFTEKILDYMKREARPVTTTEIQEAVGMSRQGAYYWIKNEGTRFVQAVGEGRNTATAYVLRSDADKYPANFRPHGTWVVKGTRGRGKDERPSFKLGSALTVTGMRIEDGETVIDMQDDGGVVFTLNVGDE